MVVLLRIAISVGLALSLCAACSLCNARWCGCAARLCTLSYALFRHVRGLPGRRVFHVFVACLRGAGTARSAPACSGAGFWSHVVFAPEVAFAERSVTSEDWPVSDVQCVRLPRCQLTHRSREPSRGSAE